MKTFYFPGCGFGFWCALAKLFIILDTEKNYKLYGSSCGSLICLISLIKKKYQNFDTIFKISNQIKKKLSFPLNLYQLSEYFIDEFIKLIDDEPKLDNIYIQITTISNKYPFIHKKIKTPESLEDLKNYVWRLHIYQYFQESIRIFVHIIMMKLRLMDIFQNYY